MTVNLKMPKRKTVEEPEDTDYDDDEPAQKKQCPGDEKAAESGFHFETKECPQELSIEPIPTSKDKIEQPELAEHEDMFIPPLGSSVVISGKSGSGKSTLLANLIRDERFYGKSATKPNGWFDKIFLFSPTANGDDVQKSLGIDKAHVFTDLDEAPDLLSIILDSQQKKLDEAEGADKVDQFAIIFDDVIGDTVFMNEKAFTRCFYQVRHVNCTTFICTQHFKRVPKVCRLQANFVFFFQGSASEVEIITDEFAPPSYTRKEFASLVNAASCEKHSFLTINMKVGWDRRFRKKLDEFIVLDRLLTGEEEESGEKKDKPVSDSESDDDEEEDMLDDDNEDPVTKAALLQVKQRHYGADEQETRGGEQEQFTPESP